MRVNLGDSDAAVGISLGVITDYIAEMARLGELPNRLELERDFNGQAFQVVVFLDPPSFEMVTAGSATPRTILHLTGSIEARPTADPTADPLVVALSAAVRLTLVLVPADPVAEVSLHYEGVEGQPSFPITAEDIDAFMTSPEVSGLINNITLPLADDLVAGLSELRFPPPSPQPAASEWAVVLTLTPAAGDDTVDAFAISVGPPGTTAMPSVTESFVAPRTGLAVVYNRPFLDLLLGQGARATEGTAVSGAVVQQLTMRMADTGISITGHVVKEIDTPIFDIAPDVDVYFSGIAVPQLVRGTIAISMDTSAIGVDVDDSDENFYGALRWVLTIGASVLLFTGVGWLTAVGIGLWLTAVQFAWDGAADLENAPGVLRQNIGAIVGAKLSLLADALDESTPAGDLTVDGTPDSVAVADGCMVFYAQVIIQSIQARMRSAEYSRKLRRFAIFELSDRRRFRAQELARLMAAGKIAVSGFHHVNGDYVRADHDKSEANNLLQSFEENETTEMVVRNHPV
jgi:hypothetical protein